MCIIYLNAYVVLEKIYYLKLCIKSINKKVKGVVINNNITIIICLSLGSGC